MTHIIYEGSGLLSLTIVFSNTRGLNFLCEKVFEGGQVTFFIYFENTLLVRSKYFATKNLSLSKFYFGAT